MVKRSLRIWEVPGSMPRISNKLIFQKNCMLNLIDMFWIKVDSSSVQLKYSSDRRKTVNISHNFSDSYYIEFV